MAEFYILPGPSRTLDRILPTASMSIKHCSPSRDTSLAEDDRRYRVDLLIVTIKGEAPCSYPFVLPCHFKPEWTSIDAFARVLGVTCVVGEPVKDEDPISRSIVRGWIALADGTVYTTRRPSNSDLIFTDLLPIQVDPVWLPEQVPAEAPQHEDAGPGFS